MSYFRDFPIIEYKFGQEATPDLFRNIAVYADVIDQVRNSVTTYQDYQVLPDERPDQASYNIYGSVNYYWTFYLMNPHLRERGWPLSQQTAFEKATKDYNIRVLTTRTKLTDRFKIGQTVSGNVSGHTGKIIHRKLDLGQLYIASNTGAFTAGETIQSTNSSGVVETIVLHSTELQINAAHHYENASKETVDIDPEVGPGAGITEVTWLERLIAQNDELRQIKVIRPNNIRQVSDAFKDALRI